MFLNDSNNKLYKKNHEKARDYFIVIGDVPQGTTLDQKTLLYYFILYITGHNRGINELRWYLGERPHISG